MTFRVCVRNAILMCSSAVVALIGVEVLLHLAPGLIPAKVRNQAVTTSNKMGLGHAYVGHLHTPNTSLLIATPDFHIAHQTDAHGFRNDWPWPERADIVVIGDSLTFGYGALEGETWPALVARAFPQLEVINLGLIGAGPEQQVRVYETFGQSLRPKLLIVGFFWGNDFWDAALFDHWLTSGDGDNYMVWREFGRRRTTGSGWRRALHQVKGWLQRRSALYPLLVHARDLYRQWRADEPKAYRTADGSQLHLWPSQFADKVQGIQPQDQSFQLAVQAFKRLHRMAQAQDMTILVVMQPSKEQVYLPLLGVSLSDVGAAFRAALEEISLDYVDLTAVFHQQASAGKTLFYQVDGHPNAQGYRLIAQEVIARVKKMALWD